MFEQAMEALGKGNYHYSVEERRFQVVRHIRLPQDFIEEACRDLGVVFDGEGFDRCYGRAARSRTRFLERRSQANRQSRLSATAEIRV